MKKTFFILFVLLSQIAFGQQTAIDSLKKVNSNYKTDEPDSMVVYTWDCPIVRHVSYKKIIDGQVVYIAKTPTSADSSRNYISLRPTIAPGTYTVIITNPDSLKKYYKYFFTVWPENFSLTAGSITTGSNIDIKTSFRHDLPNYFSPNIIYKTASMSVDMKFSFGNCIQRFFQSYIISKDTSYNNTDYYTIKITVKPALDYLLLEAQNTQLCFSFPILSAGFYKIEFEKGENNIGFNLGQNYFFVVVDNWFKYKK